MFHYNKDSLCLCDCINSHPDLVKNVLCIWAILDWPELWITLNRSSCVVVSISQTIRSWCISCCQFKQCGPLLFLQAFLTLAVAFVCPSTSWWARLEWVHSPLSAPERGEKCRKKVSWPDTSPAVCLGAYAPISYPGAVTAPTPLPHPPAPPRCHPGPPSMDI